jgi:dihydrofolate reductase
MPLSSMKARLVDEIVLQLVPVLLGAGTRLFDYIGDSCPVELTTNRSSDLRLSLT